MPMTSSPALSPSSGEESIRSDLRQLDTCGRNLAAVLDAFGEGLERGQRGQRVRAIGLFVRDDVDEAHAVAELEGSVVQSLGLRLFEGVVDGLGKALVLGDTVGLELVADHVFHGRSWGCAAVSRWVAPRVAVPREDG